MADLHKELRDKAKEIDLINFFEKENGNVHIFLSDYRIKKHFSPEVQNYLYTFLNNNWWIFESKEGSLPVSSDYKFFLNNKEIDTRLFHKVISDTKNKWEKKYPKLLFPDIVINSGGSALLFGDDKKYGNLIYINYNSFEDVNSFKSHLGHELGHIVYKELLNDNQIIFNHNNLVFKYLIILIVMSGAYFFIEEESRLFCLINQCFVLLLTGAYYFLNLKSFKNRVKRYNCEYFCDFFSYKFMKINSNHVSKLYDIGEDLNSHTHPRSSFRKKRIEKNKHNSNFKNISQSEMKYHQFLPISNLLTDQQHIALYKFFLKTFYSFMIISAFFALYVAIFLFEKIFYSFLRAGQ